MIVKTISRTYSRSINTRTYGAPESWIKIESTFTADIESGDDPVKVSQMIYEQAMKEVVADMGAIITKIRDGQAKDSTPLSPAPNVAVPAGIGAPRAL